MIERKKPGRGYEARIARIAVVAAGMIFCVVALFAPPATFASGNAASGFELTRSSHRSLHRIQEAWLQWMSAVHRDNAARAEENLKALESNARQLGMSALVDASLGAAAVAVESARNGNSERAGWALAAAERLDPGRPETAFARAEVERLGGHRWRSMVASASALVRLLRVDERMVLFANLTFWLIAVLMITAALFILVEVAAKGSAVIADLRRWLRGHISAPIAWLATVTLLLWPLVLPGGPIWLLLYWSALLWGYEGRAERWVTLGVWLIVAIGPWIAAGAERQVAIATSPPMRAIQHFANGRLYGGLFADLEVLRTVIGNEPAAQELLGDVHRTLGQWEQARLLYRDIQAAEPDNVAVLVNLGAYHFRKSDFALANTYFQQAVEQEPPSVAALYDLSLSFSETYQFEESQKALARARAIDDDQVSDWVKAANPDRVFTFDGGLERASEIRRALGAAWMRGAGSDEGAGARPGNKNLLAVLAVAVLGVGLHLLRRGKPYAEPTPWLAWRSGTISRWLRAFMPALSQVELGEGGKAAASLLALSAIVLAPRLFSFGFDLPLLFGLPSSFPWLLALGGLLVYLALCVRAELVDGE